MVPKYHSFPYALHLPHPPLYINPPPPLVHSFHSYISPLPKFLLSLNSSSQMAKTHGGHSSAYRPRMRSSPLLSPTLLSPPLRPPNLKHPSWMLLLFLPRTDMRRGRGPFLLPLYIYGQLAGPGLQRGLGPLAQVNLPTLAPRSILSLHLPRPQQLAALKTALPTPSLEGPYSAVVK